MILQRQIKACLVVVVLMFAALTSATSQELPQSTLDLINALPEGSYSDRAEVINALAATGNPLVAPILTNLREGQLYTRKSDNIVLVAIKGKDGYTLTDPVTQAEIGLATSKEITKIKVNNRLRRAIDAAMGQLTLLSPDADVRRAAAENIKKSADPASLELIDTALTAEQDADISAILLQAKAVIVLQNDYPTDEKLTAIDALTEKGDRNALAILNNALVDAPDDLKPAIESGIAKLERSFAAWSVAQNVWYGLSLGSVLLLAAIGLAITFGVMGVINMAHGEIVMLGAYTTFAVQEVIRTSFPGLFDYSLLIAMPLAFLVTALVGICIERGVIRWLYGRPLETLLATWGLSLVLQQTVRSIFGPNNREVGNPSWMSGALDIGQMSLTWSRIWIFVFAMVVFGVLLAVLKRTTLGLQMRAVTQNRRMASSMGIKTPWIDALTFGLGSGIAGIAGVALSQIDNVSPNLGQSYIIDSFMVVVFGGVGNLWGTLVGAMSLGIVNKFLEPVAGAVLAKIVILVFIILFIQRRPRGLFALKGRAVE